MRFKRFSAYLLDTIFISIILSLIMMCVPDNNNLNYLNQQINDANEQVLEGNMDAETYINQRAIFDYEISKEKIPFEIIQILLIIIGFIVIPIFNHGQTIGCKLFKIKIVRNDDEDLTYNDLLIRSVIVNSLVYGLVSLVLLFITENTAYLVLNGILGFIQFLLVIISVFMILYRKDQKGLQDIISKTMVVDCVEVE